MKKSGLADSPFFTIATPPSPVQPATLGKPLYPTEQGQAVSERSGAQPHERTTVQMSERTDAQVHSRSDEQVHNRPDAQPARSTSRESYDVYQDQAEAIDELRMQWSKERRRYVTKGQVMRELLDEIIPKKRQELRSSVQPSG